MLPTSTRTPFLALALAVTVPAYATNPATDREDYLKRIDGIVYGDNPEQGVVRGSSFLHRNLRFAIDFPPGWDVNNGQTQVVAKEGKGVVEATTLAIMNSHAVNDQPRPGERLKIVVAG